MKMVWEKKKNRGTLSAKTSLNMNNENGMGKEEKQRYTKCKKI